MLILFIRFLSPLPIAYVQKYIQQTSKWPLHAVDNVTKLQNIHINTIANYKQTVDQY